MRNGYKPTRWILRLYKKYGEFKKVYLIVKKKYPDITCYNVHVNIKKNCKNWKIYSHNSRHAKNYDKQILELRNKGLTINAIAKHLNIRFRKVYRIVYLHMNNYERQLCNIEARNKKWSKRPYHEITNTYLLKKRIIKNKALKPICCICRWDYKKDKLWHKLSVDFRYRSIPVQLDHIDGDKTNNHIENLRFLCPNCHALQPTSFRPKPKGFVHKYKKIKYKNNRLHGKLTLAQVKEIRNKYVAGIYTVEKLAKEYDISNSSMYKIVKGFTYENSNN